MRSVLHVISGLQVGGAEMALLKLIVSSQGNAYSHRVVALAPDGEMRQRFENAGIPLTVLDFKRAPLIQFFRLSALIRNARPDIVQTWMYHADLLGGLAARLAGNRNIIWGIRTTDLKSSGSRATAAVRKVCSMLSGWVPHTIVCVAEAARRTHAAVGYDAARMQVIPNGFDTSSSMPTASQRLALRKECGFPDDAAVVGAVGRFSDEKDQANFVRAAGMLAAQHRQLRFMMVGRDVDSANVTLSGWIADTGHADRFVLLGERADIRACLFSMDVFCLSSRTEGFPNVVGEAMAMAVPCVVTDVGDAALLVGDTGLVVIKEDAVALAAALARLLAFEPAHRLAMGQAAAERIRRLFTVENTRAGFEAIYQRIAGKGVI